MTLEFKGEANLPPVFASHLKMVDTLLDCENPEPPYFAVVYSGKAGATIDLTKDGEPIDIREIERMLAMLACRKEIKAICLTVPAMGLNKDDMSSEELQRALQCRDTEELKKALGDVVRNMDLAPTVFSCWFERGRVYLAMRIMESTDPLTFGPWIYHTSAEAIKNAPLKNPFGLGIKLSEAITEFERRTT